MSDRLRRMRMIVVEGPDGSGKTTLVKKIAHTLNLPIAQRVVTKQTQPMRDLQAWVDDNLDQGLRPTLYDRHRLISEPIYGPVLRKRMQPGFDDWRWLSYRQQKFRNLKPLVIFCIPPLNIVRETVLEDEDNKVVWDHVDTLYWLYVNAVTLWEDALVFDWTMSTSSTSVHSIERSCEIWLAKKSLRTPLDPG
jgi:energy-coupling factor transporter ATP-binding protein EcfA2